jgi:tRNA pseudouridine55 synthase
MTSHDVVSRCRRIFGTRKVGHAGTLDPMATGVLVIGIERATKILGLLSGTSKSYAATIRLGRSTTTDDAEGDLVADISAVAVTDDAISVGVAALRGEIAQRPSAVSAIKVGGKRAYQRVREGEEVELAARPVHIDRFDVLAIRRDGEFVNGCGKSSHAGDNRRHSCWRDVWRDGRRRKTSGRSGSRRR